jgi:hypothetical protein
VSANLSRRERWSSRWRTQGWHGLPTWAANWIYWNAGGRRAIAWFDQLGFDHFADEPYLPVTDCLWEWAKAHPQVRSLIVSKASRPSPLADQADAGQVEMQPAGVVATVVTDSYLFQIPGGVITGQKGLLRLTDGSFALEWADNPAVFAAELALYAREPRRPVERLAGDFYSLLAPYPPDSQHWVNHRLLPLYAVLGQLPPDTRFIVPALLGPDQRERLQAMGIAPDRLISYAGHTTWELEMLYFACGAGRSPADQVEAA